MDSLQYASTGVITYRSVSLMVIGQSSRVQFSAALHTSGPVLRQKVRRGHVRSGEAGGRGGGGGGGGGEEAQPRAYTR
ncbi:unnamed protein product [Soboliphyme baturini]|uniref:Uncharacterized protein n=1 Tax=Soboliphyme baturini TaxID=241478 RepID=A0A183J983_9BILA|nr:unnamed protein product [Soboliphyme baturini]